MHIYIHIKRTRAPRILTQKWEWKNRIANLIWDRKLRCGGRTTAACKRNTSCWSAATHGRTWSKHGDPVLLGANVCVASAHRRESPDTQPLFEHSRSVLVHSSLRCTAKLEAPCWTNRKSMTGKPGIYPNSNKYNRYKDIYIYLMLDNSWNPEIDNNVFCD